MLLLSNLREPGGEGEGEKVGVRSAIVICLESGRGFAKEVGSLGSTRFEDELLGEGEGEQIGVGTEGEMMEATEDDGLSDEDDNDGVMGNGVGDVGTEADCKLVGGMDELAERAVVEDSGEDGTMGV
jgi:hypothetical protein